MRRNALVEARKSANKTQEQVAEEVGVDRTMVGKWERGEATPDPGERRARYAESIHITLSELHAALSNMPVTADDAPTPLKIALAVEQAATEIRAHVQCVVNGLLQTPRYAAAIARAVGTTPTPQDYVQRNVEQRAHRQQRVLNGDVQVHVIQPEASLRSRLGDDETMATQMRHLAEMAGRPNITVQVVPFSVGQYEAQRIGTFSLNVLPWSASPTVDLQAYGGIRLIDSADEVAHFHDAFEHAGRAALTPQTSIQFIEQLAGEWENR